MVAVKGSKQTHMVVVPHRPWRQALVVVVMVVAALGGAWFSYQHGQKTAMEDRMAIVEERDAVRAELADTLLRLNQSRRQLAELEVGGEIDSQANQAVQETVENLQAQVAQLSEEVQFYKGIMVPNANSRGLRIERMDVRAAGDPNHYRYSLLLTQVVDEHEYVQGGVSIKLEGRRGDADLSLPLADVTMDEDEDLRFRFRYFQNLDGEMTIPADFEPRAITVVAEATGRGAQRLERSFEWEG